MSKLAQWARSLWLEAELAAPPIVRRRLIPPLYYAKDITQLMLKPYLNIWQWQGQSQGGLLTVNYAGTEKSKPFLKNQLFTEKPIEEKIGRIPIWHLNGLTKLSASDISIIEANKRQIDRLSSSNALVLPIFVSMFLDVQGDWPEVKSRFRKSVRSELRMIRKYGYEYEISRSNEDIEVFYREMYLPTMEIRHGDRASPMSYVEANQYFRHGFLFFVKRDEKRVAGSVCLVEQDIIHFILMGVIDGNQQLMKEGVVGALNYLRVQWANQNGYKSVDFGWYRPVMTMLFRNKRKWGTTAKVPTNVKDCFWIRLERNTPPVSQLMKNLPFIIDYQDQLFGLITVDNPEIEKKSQEAKWRKQFQTPGLQGLLICSIDDFFSEIKISPTTSIIF